MQWYHAVDSYFINPNIMQADLATGINGKYHKQSIPDMSMQWPISVVDDFTNINTKITGSTATSSIYWYQVVDSYHQQAATSCNTFDIQQQITIYTSPIVFSGRI